MISPERSPANAESTSRAPETVETGKRHKRGRRGRGSRTADAIQGKARQRQKAWLETDQPYTTFKLTRELDVLYDEHRDEQAGTLTDPYRGRTWGVR